MVFLLKSDCFHALVSKIHSREVWQKSPWTNGSYWYSKSCGLFSFFIQERFCFSPGWMQSIFRLQKLYASWLWFWGEFWSLFCFGYFYFFFFKYRKQHMPKKKPLNSSKASSSNGEWLSAARIKVIVYNKVQIKSLFVACHTDITFWTRCMETPCPGCAFSEV